MKCQYHERPSFQEVHKSRYMFLCENCITIVDIFFLFMKMIINSSCYNCHYYYNHLYITIYILVYVTTVLHDPQIFYLLNS